MRRATAILLASLLSTACYHYSFEQRTPQPGEVLTRHSERRPTWFNGLVGTGRVDTTRYCEEPVRTELQVRPTDVLISVLTLLIYTPHTLYVTCGSELVAERR